MKNQFNNVLLALAGVIIIAMMTTVIYFGNQLVYYKTLLEKTDTTTVVTTDTIYKDHYFVEKEPEQKTEYIIKREIVYQKLNEDSTLAMPIEIHLKKKDYEGELQDSSVTLKYKATVSGRAYQDEQFPLLDSISFDIKHKQINTYTTTTIQKPTIYKQPKWSVNIGIGSGYGIINKQLDIYVGVTLGYNIWNK